MSSFEDLAQLPDRISFSKYSASANDFIVVDNRGRIFSECASSFARRVCARRYSVGADGLILIEDSRKASIKVRYFNPDGNEFSTCGNGGRCAARFAHHTLVTQPKMTLETNAGIIDAEVIGNNVKLKFLAPTEIRLNVPLELDGKRLLGHFIRLGDPHFVLYGKGIREHDIVPFARRIRYHEIFAPEGTNVHFIEPESPQKVKIRTYERGVEDETLACGSGCVSSAIATFESKRTVPPICFEPQSGIPLIVHFQPDNGFNDLYLEGDARLIYRGKLSKEAMFGFPEDPL